MQCFRCCFSPPSHTHVCTFIFKEQQLTCGDCDGVVVLPQFNPYGPNLQLDNFKEMLNEWRTKLQGEGEEEMEGASSSSPAKASTAAVSSEELSGSGETAVEEEFASSAMETDFGDMDPTDKDVCHRSPLPACYFLPQDAVFFLYL